MPKFLTFKGTVNGVDDERSYGVFLSDEQVKKISDFEETNNVQKINDLILGAFKEQLININSPNNITKINPVKIEANPRDAYEIYGHNPFSERDPKEIYNANMERAKKATEEARLKREKVTPALSKLSNDDIDLSMKAIAEGLALVGPAHDKTIEASVGLERQKEFLEEIGKIAEYIKTINGSVLVDMKILSEENAMKNKKGTIENEKEYKKVKDIQQKVKEGKSVNANDLDFLSNYIAVNLPNRLKGISDRVLSYEELNTINRARNDVVRYTTGRLQEIMEKHKKSRTITGSDMAEIKSFSRNLGLMSGKLQPTNKEVRAQEISSIERMSKINKVFYKEEISSSKFTQDFSEPRSLTFGRRLGSNLLANTSKSDAKLLSSALNVALDPKESLDRVQKLRSKIKPGEKINVSSIGSIEKTKAFEQTLIVLSKAAHKPDKEMAELIGNAVKMDKKSKKMYSLFEELGENFPGIKSKSVKRYYAVNELLKNIRETFSNEDLQKMPKKERNAVEETVKQLSAYKDNLHAALVEKADGIPANKPKTKRSLVTQFEAVGIPYDAEAKFKARFKGVNKGP